MFNDKRGQTLIELIVVISVSLIVISALVFATISSLRNAQFSKHQSQATKLAQEGIERVRVGRDRNKNISSIPGATINSWNGDSTGNGSIWNYRISTGCGQGVFGTACYFKFSTTSDSNLTWINSSTTFPLSFAEDIYGDGRFRRAIILNDDSAYNIQKTVTVVVTWTDFSGSHESRLTTILGKI